MPENNTYNENVCQATKALRQESVDRAREKKIKKRKEGAEASLSSTPADAIRRPSKEERQLQAAARRTSIQLAQLAAGRCAQSLHYDTPRR